MRRESFRQAEVKLELQDILNANTFIREDVMKTLESLENPTEK